jgi:plastocyanin
MKRFLTIAFVTLFSVGWSWPTTDASSSTHITMEDGSPYYVPVRATVVSGIPIRWDNPTPTHHTVTHNGCIEDGQPCLFDSGPVPPGAQFTVPGLPAGQYGYHCRIHPIMRGVLTVTDAPATPSQL